MQSAWDSFDSKFLGTFLGRCIFLIIFGSMFGGGILWVILDITLGGYKHAVETIGIEIKGVKTEVVGLRQDLANGDIPSVNFQIDTIKSDIKAEFADMKGDMNQQVFDAIDELKAGQDEFFEEIRVQHKSIP